MIEDQLAAILETAGVAKEPMVVRFYKDGVSSHPRVVIQRDIQGCRVMFRPASDPSVWTCAWYGENGELIAAEKFCCGRQNNLDAMQTCEFLRCLLSEPFKDMAREGQSLPS